MPTKENGYIKTTINITEKQEGFLDEKSEKAEEMGLEFVRSKYFRILLDKEMEQEKGEETNIGKKD